jgi:predicted outer membrane repeat protein
MYNLSTVLTVSDGYNFTMSSTNATVTCTSATARFEFNRVENVHISGMTFQGCRNTAISMSQVTSASIVRSTFFDNQAVSGSSRHGGCLYIVSSSVTISESVFQNNRAYFGGGAIYASSSIVRIIRSQFSYNTQEYRYSGNGGGAVSALYSNIIINESVFTYNNAHRRYSDGGGGAIRMYGSGTFQVINTLFIGNRADGNRRVSGGAIYTSGLSAMIIQCQFINNYASENGGGLYNIRGSLIVIQTNFSSNSAAAGRGGYFGSGGGIYTEGTLNISECNFLNNIASGNGGGIYNTGGTTITDCNVVNNIASGSGGGIYNTGGTLTTTECNFLNNIASESGGAIYKTGSNDVVVIGRNSYSNNTAYSFGGAVYVLGTNSSISVLNLIVISLITQL